MWIADSNDGSFEAESYKELTEQVIGHCVERYYPDVFYPDLKVYWQNEWGGTCRLSRIGQDRFDEYCADAISDAINEAISDGEETAALHRECRGML